MVYQSKESFYSSFISMHFSLINCFLYILNVKKKTKVLTIIKKHIFLLLFTVLSLVFFITGTCFSLIFIILFLPLFLFTSGTSLGSLSSLNQIKQVKLQVGISTFPSFFEMQIQSKSPINMKDPNEYKKVELLNPKLQQIPYADTKEYENKEVQKLGQYFKSEVFQSERCSAKCSL